MAFGIIVGIIIVFVVACFAYGVFMIFWPEWVGITGKTALEYEKSHAEGSGPECQGSHHADQPQDR